jgi:hypothetical protein
MNQAVGGGGGFQQPFASYGRSPGIAGSSNLFNPQQFGGYARPNYSGFRGTGGPGGYY